MKKWIVSILCYLMALALPIYTIIAVYTFDEDLIFLTWVLLGSVTPSLMFIIIGLANHPRK